MNPRRTKIVATLGPASSDAKTLTRMIEDEVGHITWVKDRLDRYAAEKGGNVVAETMRRAALSTPGGLAKAIIDWAEKVASKAFANVDRESCGCCT